MWCARSRAPGICAKPGPRPICASCPTRATRRASRARCTSWSAPATASRAERAGTGQLAAASGSRQAQPVFHRFAQPLRHEARGFVAALGACCALGCGGVAASPDAAPSPEAAPEAAEPRPPLSRPPAKASRAGGCAADGVVWGSVELRTPAQVDALAGCERVAGDLSLLGLVSTPTTALSSLKAVDGVLSVLGIATEVALDGFVSLEQVGGLVLQ